MRIDFFCSESCTEPPVSQKLFGLVDRGGRGADGRMLPAGTAAHNPEEWTATVENPGCKLIQFTGIDHNEYFLPVYGKADSKCDGLLYYKDDILRRIIFVELKTGGNTKKWVREAKNQLAATVKKFCICHDNGDAFMAKEAYASNGMDKKGTSTNIQNYIDELAALGFDFVVSDRIRM